MDNTFQISPITSPSYRYMNPQEQIWASMCSDLDLRCEGKRRHLIDNTTVEFLYETIEKMKGLLEFPGF